VKRGRDEWAVGVLLNIPSARLSLHVIHRVSETSSTNRHLGLRENKRRSTKPGVENHKLMG
jgi:hypothetical protein